MQRRTALLLLSVCLLGTLGGCRAPASPLASNPFGAKPAATATDDNDSRFLAAFKRNRKDSAAGSASESSSDRDVRQASFDEDRSFDPETQALIDEALAGASPQRQAEVREQLKTVPVAMIPKLLLVYKLSQQESQANALDQQRYPGSLANGPPTLANQTRSLNDPTGGHSGGMAGYQNPRAGNEFTQNNRPTYPTVPNQTQYGQHRDPRVVPAGSRVDLSQPTNRVEQAVWNTQRDPSLPQTASQIANHVPGHGMQQAGYAEPEKAIPLFAPDNQLGTRPQSGIGYLKPGERPQVPAQTTEATSVANAGGTVQHVRAIAPNSAAYVPTDQKPMGYSNGQPGWQTQLEQLISTVERDISHMRPGMGDDEATRDYIKHNAQLRMLYLMSAEQAQQERAWEPIPGIDPAQQGFWHNTFYGFTNYFDPNPEYTGGQRYSQAVKSFARATSELRKAANLEIGDIALCSSILNFGNYKRFEEYEFSPGQQVALYAEIRNFLSQVTEENQHRVLLNGKIEFMSPGNGSLSGRVIEQVSPDPAEDLCKYPRNDFYLAYLIHIPAKLLPGHYVMKLTVTDTLANKVAESRINFKVK